MSAIVVTVPKSQQGHVLGEKFAQTSGYIYWRLPQLPRALDSPKWADFNYCYFVWNGAVRTRYNIVDFIDAEGYPVWDHAPLLDDVPGPAVLLYAYTQRRLNEHVPMKSFQGFRYYEPEGEGP